VLQKKLMNIFQVLEGKDDEGGDDGFGVRSPNMDIDGGAGWQDGSLSPYGNGNQSAWGGNATTPYNAQTPYGTSGQSGWS